ncbi:MAG: hypothetical protein ACJ736_08940, partial [Streptomyces sp.]
MAVAVAVKEILAAISVASSRNSSCVSKTSADRGHEQCGEAVDHLSVVFHHPPQAVPGQLRLSAANAR